MSDHIQSRPLSPKGRENYDQIFRKKLTPGTVRKYRSACCGAEMIGRGVCSKCRRKCGRVLTPIYP